MKVYFKGWLTVLALALGALVMITLATQPTRAAGPWYVAPGGSDGNACTSPGTACATINGAIAKASSGDTIYVATGTYTGTGDEVVLLDKNVTLSGGWDGTFTTQSATSTIDGEGVRRGITVNSGVTAFIERFVVQNGYGWAGGGINNDGTLTLNNSSISGNTSECWAIENAGVFTANNSTISENVGTSHGCVHPAVMNWDVGVMTLNNTIVSDNEPDGGIRNYGTLTLTNSSVSGNTGGDLGGIDNWGGGTVTLNNSTVSGNTASHGGGIYNGNGTMTLNNSTVSGNTASTGGGIRNRWDGTLTLNNSTVSGNAATGYDGDGGGIYNDSGTVTLQNTILAGNTASGTGPDCSGAVGSSGYNLVGDTSGCDFSPGTGDLTDVNANLGQLIGSPRYHPLLSGSPAIDAGNPAGCTDHLGNPLPADQRGAARVGRCDMGAYEYTTPGPAASILALSGTPQRTPLFSTFETPLQAAVLDSIGSPVNNATVTFSAPESGASGTFADSGTFTTTAVTNESGVATAATFTANGLEGSYTVTATVSGVVTPANFLLSNVGWYVSPGGSDGNDCQTPTTPCATINGALGKAGFTADDVVLVASGTYTGTGDEVVLLDKSVRLLGGWDDTFTTQSGTSTIDGEDARRGIGVNWGASGWPAATVEHFTVQNGSGWPSGGIYNHGTLTLNNSAVSGNTATGNAGGIYNDGTLTLNNSTVSGNMDGGIDNWYDSTLTLNNSTVSGNMDGGIHNYGTLALNNSTVSGNTDGGIDNDGTLTLNSSTVSDNTASGNGGGISSSGTVTLQNTILAGNTASGTGPDCNGNIGSSGYNLIGDTSGCTFIPADGDLTNVDPKLGPLEGSPAYHPLLPGSPAINAGNPAGCTDHLGNPLLTDQRGVSRVGRCDIGSYEYEGVSIQIFLPIILRNY